MSVPAGSDMAVRPAASKSHKCHSPLTMFTKQVSRSGGGLDPHRGRRGGAGRANSKKDLVMGPIEVFVPYTCPATWARGSCRRDPYTRRARPLCGRGSSPPPRRTRCLGERGRTRRPASSTTRRRARTSSEEQEPLAAEEIREGDACGWAPSATTPSCQTTPPPPSGDLRNSQVRPI
jgi:hypothetical protein